MQKASRLACALLVATLVMPSKRAYGEWRGAPPIASPIPLVPAHMRHDRLGPPILHARPKESEHISRGSGQPPIGEDIEDIRFTAIQALCTIKLLSTHSIINSLQKM